MTCHRTTMINHLIWLRHQDADYARYALKDYVTSYPDLAKGIEEDVRTAWKNHKNLATIDEEIRVIR